MTAKFVFFIFALFHAQVFAARGSSHIFLCSVVSFDQNEIMGQCDPGRPKKYWKIPREWLVDEDKVRVNQMVRFTLDGKQLEQWLAMNKKSVKKGKA